MRTAALIFGTFGGFTGVYFAQLLVTGAALFGAIAAAFGGKNAQEPLYYGLAALATYTLGVIGGILAIHRARAAATLMGLAAIVGLALTLGTGLSAAGVVTPQASAQPTPGILRGPPVLPRATPAPTPVAVQPTSPEAYALLSIPFVGPAFLLLGALLALGGASEGQAIGANAQPVRIGRRPLLEETE